MKVDFLFLFSSDEDVCAFCIEVVTTRIEEVCIACVCRYSQSAHRNMRVNIHELLVPVVVIKLVGSKRTDVGLDASCANCHDVQSEKHDT